MEVLRIILYVLGAIFLVSLIVLSIKLIYSVERINVLLDNVERKMKTIDKIFDVFDRFADSFSNVSDKLIDSVANIFSKIFSKKKKRIRDKEDK